MANRTDRDLEPSPDHGRRRFMIAGEHVILRALESEDLDRCYNWMNDPNIVRTLKSRYPIPFEQEAEWLEDAVHPSVAERHFAVERKDNRLHIGNASLSEIDWVSRKSKFNLFIGDPASWNRGYGKDAIAALVRFAFQEMNLQKLSIQVFEYNERAKHILEALGFTTEGVLKRDFYREGKYHDLVIFSIFSDGAHPTEEPQS